MIMGCHDDDMWPPFLSVAIIVQKNSSSQDPSVGDNPTLSLTSTQHSGFHLGINQNITNFKICVLSKSCTVL